LKEKIKVYVRGLGKIALAPFKWILYLFVKIVDYTGPFAAILKGLPVAAMALLILSPFILYTWLLNIAQFIRPPLSYLLYISWLTYIGLLVVGASVLGYVMETKVSSRKEPKSVEHQRQEADTVMDNKKREWNAEQIVKEYLETLEKQNDQH